MRSSRDVIIWLLTILIRLLIPSPILLAMSYPTDSVSIGTWNSTSVTSTTTGSLSSATIGVKTGMGSTIESLSKTDPYQSTHHISSPDTSQFSTSLPWSSSNTPTLNVSYGVPVDIDTTLNVPTASPHNATLHPSNVLTSEISVRIATKNFTSSSQFTEGAVTNNSTPINVGWTSLSSAGNPGSNTDYASPETSNLESTTVRINASILLESTTLPPGNSSNIISTTRSLSSAILGVDTRMGSTIESLLKTNSYQSTHHISSPDTSQLSTSLPWSSSNTPTLNVSYGVPVDIDTTLNVTTASPYNATLHPSNVLTSEISVRIATKNFTSSSQFTESAVTNNSTPININWTSLSSAGNPGSNTDYASTKTSTLESTTVRINASRPISLQSTTVPLENSSNIISMTHSVTVAIIVGVLATSCIIACIITCCIVNGKLRSMKKVRRENVHLFQILHSLEQIDGGKRTNISATSSDPSNQLSRDTDYTDDVTSLSPTQSSYLSDLRKINEHLLQAKRHLAAYLDDSRFMTASGANDDTNATSLEEEHLIECINRASQTIACCTLAMDSRSGAAMCRLPLPPPWQRPERRSPSRHADTVILDIKDGLSVLKTHVSWLSYYVTIATRETENADESDRQWSPRRQLVLRRRREGDEIERSTAEPEVIRELRQIDGSILHILRKSLGDVMALVNISRDEIDATTSNDFQTTPSFACDFDEVPWLLDGSQCRWSMNPESYYSELSDINPAFVQLADRLAIVRRRLQTIEEEGRLSINWSTFLSETTELGIDGISWRACLLASIDLVVNYIEEMFSDVDGGPAADAEVSDRPPSANDIGHVTDSAYRCSSPAVEAEGCQLNADQHRVVRDENATTSSAEMTQSDDVAMETGVLNFDDATAACEEVQWDLADGGDFRELLIDRLDRFSTTFDDRITAANVFFRHFVDVDGPQFDDTTATVASVDDTSNAIGLSDFPSTDAVDLSTSVHLLPPNPRESMEPPASLEMSLEMCEPTLEQVTSLELPQQSMRFVTSFDRPVTSLTSVDDSCINELDVIASPAEDATSTNRHDAITSPAEDATSTNPSPVEDANSPNRYDAIASPAEDATSTNTSPVEDANSTNRYDAITSPAEDATSTNRHDAIASPAEDATSTNRYDAIASPAEDATSTNRYDAIASPVEDANSTNRYDAIASPAEDATSTNTSPVEDATSTNRYDAITSPAEDATYTNTSPVEDATSTNRYDAITSPAEDATSTNRHDAIASPAEDATSTNRYDAIASPAEDATSTNRHDVITSPAEDATSTNTLPVEDATSTNRYDAIASPAEDATSTNRHDVITSPAEDATSTNTLPVEDATSTNRYDAIASPAEDATSTNTSPVEDATSTNRHDAIASPAEDATSTNRYDAIMSPVAMASYQSCSPRDQQSDYTGLQQLNGSAVASLYNLLIDTAHMSRILRPTLLRRELSNYSDAEHVTIRRMTSSRVTHDYRSDYVMDDAYHNSGNVGYERRHLPRRPVPPLPLPLPLLSDDVRNVPVEMGIYPPLSDDEIYEDVPSHIHHQPPMSIQTTPAAVRLQASTNEDIYTVDDYALNDYTVDDVYADYAEPFFEITVDRTSEHLMDDVFDHYDRFPINELKLLRKTRVHFTGEVGYDIGALTRDFFHIVFRSLIADAPGIRSQQAFHGRDQGHLLPTINADLVMKWRVFRFVGIVVVQAVRAGCHGLPGLCDGVRHFLAGGARISSIADIVDRFLTVDDVADEELRQLLIKIEAGTELLNEDRLLLDSWLEQSSYTHPFTSSQGAAAVRHILCYYVFNSRMFQLQAIAEGMAEMGYKPNRVDVDTLFPSEVVLRKDDVVNRLHFEYDTDIEGECEQVERYFRSFVNQLCAGEIGDFTLEDLVLFITGAPYFATNNPLTITFALPTHESVLPVVHACFNELVLPTVHQTYTGFRQAMVTALEYGGVGFGLA